MYLFNYIKSFILGLQWFMGCCLAMFGGALLLNPALAADCVTVGNLVWEQKTNDGGLRDKDNYYDWYDSTGPANNRGNPGSQGTVGGGCTGGILCNTEAYVAAVNAANVCGHNDWRLPTWEELNSLVNKSHTPTIDPSLFPETKSGGYWTAATPVNNNGAAWYINFQDGNENASSGKSAGYYVRLVRGPKAPDKCVTIGSLTWEVKTGRGTLRAFDNYYSWYDPSSVSNNRGNPGTQGGLPGCSAVLNCDTQAYVNAVNAANVCGYNDWRLPTWEELNSLVNKNYTPTIDQTVFLPNEDRTRAEPYWTAATNVSTNSYAWYIDFQDGSEGSSGYSKSSGRYVRLVRGPKALDKCVTVGNLTWEVKSGRGTLRAFDNYYTWYDPNPATNGGNAGTQGGLGGCQSILTCDTSTYIKALNDPKVALCGYTDWRMPTREELNSLVNMNYTPTIDQTVFLPNEDRTRADPYWTATPEVDRTWAAWSINFSNGAEEYHGKSGGYYVRAIRYAPPSTTGGASFSVMVNALKSVAYTTGANALGQLGAGPTFSPSGISPQVFYGRSVYPVRVYWSSRSTRLASVLAEPLAATDTPDFIAIAAGTSHILALRSDGSVWAWGDNANGQLGNGTLNGADQPTAVVTSGGAPLTDVVAIAAGRDHSVVVKGDSTVWTWGKNAHGQLGDNSDTATTRVSPVQVLTSDLKPLTGVRMVAASDVHTMALKTDGTVWAWGDNTRGELGSGDTIAHPTAIQVQVLNDAKSIQARGTDLSARNLALRSDGSIWGWGDNSFCQLGQATAALTNPILTPVRLTNLSNLGMGLSNFASGHFHGIARKDNGSAWTWGDNSKGQLGDGTTTPGCTPIQVSGVSGVETVGAGVDHSVVTLFDGTVRSWGNNDEGQLGVGDTAAHATAKQMLGENGAGILDLKAEPATTYPLTLATAGSGSGTVNGAGNYAAGATVTLTATPASGSTFGGWSPSPPCAPSFTMPASALTCTATFTAGATLPGDVNGDNIVNALDVVAVINAVLGISSLPAADVNGDGVLNALDVVFVINEVLAI